jgi:hypothetical protein
VAYFHTAGITPASCCQKAETFARIFERVLRTYVGFLLNRTRPPGQLGLQSLMDFGKDHGLQELLIVHEIFPGDTAVSL